MKRLAALALGCIAAVGCSRDTYAPAFTGRAGVKKTYSFGVHPLHNPQRLYEVYGPIAEHASRRLADAALRVEASRSYEDFELKLFARRFDFALPNPYQTLEALKHGYRVFGKMGDDAEFRGIIVVRRDGGVERIADLEGKVVSFPAPTAVAATMQPLLFLAEHGLDVNRGIRRLYAGSQESSIMSVYMRRSAAGATWPIPWRAFVTRSPELAKELVVRWETSSLVNNGLVVRDDVPRDVAEEVARALFGLHESEEGRRLLAAVPISRFEPATAATYAPVAEFLVRYRRTVQP